jgi:hypothetical protein
MSTLDDVLSEQEKQPDPVEGQIQKNESIRQKHRDKEMEARGQLRDTETGQYKAKEESKPEVKEEPKQEVKAEIKPEVKPEVKTVEEMTAKEKAAFAKAADETRKRQALEARIKELEAKTTPAEQPKPFYDDPDGALNRQKQEIQNLVLNMKLQTSEASARSRYNDFDEKINLFSELTMNTPGLGIQMVNAPDPAEFAYRTAANHLLYKQMEELGGMEAYKKKVEAEATAKVRAEVEAELKKKAEELQKEKDKIPGSLSDAPSKGVNRPVWSGPTPLGDIIGR